MTAIASVWYAPNTYRVKSSCGYVISNMSLEILKAAAFNQSRHLPPGSYWCNIHRLIDGAWVEV